MWSRGRRAGCYTFVGKCFVEIRRVQVFPWLIRSHSTFRSLVFTSPCLPIQHILPISAPKWLPGISLSVFLSLGCCTLCLSKEAWFQINGPHAGYLILRQHLLFQQSARLQFIKHLCGHLSAQVAPESSKYIHMIINYSSWQRWFIQNTHSLQRDWRTGW